MNTTFGHITFHNPWPQMNRTTNGMKLDKTGSVLREITTFKDIKNKKVRCSTLNAISNIWYDTTKQFKKYWWQFFLANGEHRKILPAYFPAGKKSFFFHTNKIV